MVWPCAIILIPILYVLILANTLATLSRRSPNPVYFIVMLRTGYVTAAIIKKKAVEWSRFNAKCLNSIRVEYYSRINLRFSLPYYCAISKSRPTASVRQNNPLKQKERKSCYPPSSMWCPNFPVANLEFQCVHSTNRDLQTLLTSIPWY